MKKLLVAFCFCWLSLVVPKAAFATVTIHEFSGNDGSAPQYSTPVISAGVIYGTTRSGGDSDHGVIFSVHVDGSNYTRLHSFDGGVDDGSNPYGSVILFNNKLYGMTLYGGDTDQGILYSINPDGSNFTILREFTGGSNDGGQPYSNDLVVDGTKLYGFTTSGGISGRGIIFSIDGDGANFTILHKFAGGPSDGSYPYGSPVIISGKIYGTTYGGGQNDDGIIFSMDSNGSNFTVLHDFSSLPDDTMGVQSTLTYYDSKLFGTAGGFAGDRGGIFSINLDGSNYTLLHQFTGDSDGSAPYSGLTVVDGKLYSVTSIGGNTGYGQLFSINPDGSNFTPLHSLLGDSDAASQFGGNLVLSGNYLYGLSGNGGTPDLGMVYEINLADLEAPSLTVALSSPDTDLTPSFAGTATDVSGTVVTVQYQVDSTGSTWHDCTPDDGTFDEAIEDFTCQLLSRLDIRSHIIYLRTRDSYGNITNVGSETEYSFTPVSAINSLYGYEQLRQLDTSDGSLPYHSTPVVYNNQLYTSAPEGGSNGVGTIFKFNSDGTGFTNIYDFNGTSDGGYPYGTVTVVNDRLYGLTYGGGANDQGTIYSVKSDGTDFQSLYSFAGDTEDGSHPYDSLLFFNNKLYGMTPQGGPDGYGTIFSLDLDGSNYSVLHFFHLSSTDGGAPYGSLIAFNSKLYGLTSGGGASDTGTMFSINPDGSDFTILYSFSEEDGTFPDGSLLEYNGTFYGMTASGGGTSNGVVFSISPDGSNYTILHNFEGEGSDGGYPDDTLINIDNTLYGLTSYGGSNNYGAMFSIKVDGTEYTLLHEFLGSPDGARPYGSLVSKDNKLFGLTQNGGTSNGSLFSLTLTTEPSPSPTPTPTPSSNSTSESSSSEPQPEAIQIQQTANGNQGVTVSPTKDSNPGDKKIEVVVPSETFDFNAYLQVNKTKPIDVLPPKTIKSNAVVVGDGSVMAIKSNGSLYWQVGELETIWFKTYAPKGKDSATIIPSQQKKSSIVILSFKDSELFHAGSTTKKFDSKKLQIAYSADGITWKILPYSVVNTTNHTIAVAHKLGGYYAIVAK